MPFKSPTLEPPAASWQDAADLLQALETLRNELGSVADDIISVLREAGVTPAQQSKPH